MQSEAVGVYVHIPFCVKKCGYCDFNAYSGYKPETMRRYVDALCAEIRHRAEPETLVQTIFFGGGTPTTLEAAELVQIADCVRESFAVEDTAEITVEANPGDARSDYLETLRGNGFNRLSFGVQTFSDRLLKTIDRIHSAEEAKTAVHLAKAAGFDNISIDLMFALPRQTLPDWERTLDQAFALDLPHLSMYGLIVEEGTAFFARRERGKLVLPSEKMEAAMFGRAIERATAAGYLHYEVSNYARPGYESRHNQIYWRNEPYFGFGAGAASYLNGVRMMNERLPNRYADTVFAQGAAIITEEQLTVRETMGETMMVGLRLRQGVSNAAFAGRFGMTIDTAFPDVVRTFTENGLLERSGEFLRLTPRGLFFASDVMADFLT